jgi:exopolysaccharide production protein ExoQ
MKINENVFWPTVVTFFTVSGLLFNNMVGTLAALTFLVAGGWGLASNIQHSVTLFSQYKLMFVIPFLFLVSTMWSEVPMITLRSSIQLILTTLIAISIASKFKMQHALRATGFAMLIAMVLSLFSSNQALNGMTGEYSLIGIFASKNFLAIHTALCIFVGLTIVLNQKLDRVSRIAGSVLFVVSFLVLLKAKSLGSTLFVVLALLVTFIITVYSNFALHRLTRKRMNWFIAVLTVFILMMMVVSLATGLFDEFMYYLGKDPTLTGRTYIWERGLELIESAPVLGVGYQSVFYVGNDTAEDIWEFAHVPSGAGFNFHNMFVHITVELGILGLLTFICMLSVFYRKIFSSLNVQMGGETFFATLVITYLTLQTLLEAVWFNQFSLVQFLLCMAWVYLKGTSTNEQ